MNLPALRPLSLFFLTIGPGSLTAATVEPKDGNPSYHEDIRPLFQAKCHGCHQPAKAKGDYIMTEFSALMKGGEEGPAIIAGKPGDSLLVQQITPDAEGEIAMPPKGDPLTPEESAMVAKWIAQGAANDSPEGAGPRFSPKNPPEYTTAPVVTSLAWSPDGGLLAVAGFHEVILLHADGSGLDARLVGLSERIESLAFSPDGKRLAVSGGLPGRTGEIQIWDLEKRRLDLSVPTTHDTVYGVSWSPDGKRVAYGCADSTLRAIDSESGEQVLFQGGHNDWVLATTFSRDGKHLVSAGRDMTAKLTEVATERLIDNITSITPGALKGGITTLALRPDRDEVLVGGSDGSPQVFRLFRASARKIGDNSNLVRRFPNLDGRIFGVAWNPAGNRVAAVSSLDGRGQLRVYSADFDAAIPDDVKKIFAKTGPSRSPEERKRVEEFQSAGVAPVFTRDLGSGAYAVTFSQDGKRIAVGGGDGGVRVFDAESGKLEHAAVAVPLNDNVKPPVLALEIDPPEVRIEGPHAYTQLVISAWSADGLKKDVTREVKFTGSDQKVATVDPNGKVLPGNDGKGSILATLDGIEVRIPVEVTGQATDFHPDYVRDVMPVVSRLGCNAGTCHGAKDGKNGFKLSLRGYDPVFDVRALTDDLAGRRINRASPRDSLMLLKAAGIVPHEGGVLTKPGESHYEILRQWIEDGAGLDLESPRVTGIEISPSAPVIAQVGDSQQIRVVATYADGTRRDVTAEAFVESGNGDVIEADDAALLTSLRRGEAPVLARFEGTYAATTITVMGDRSGFEWSEPAKFNPVDEFVAAKWKRLKILPSDLCTDAEFLRRVTLDLTGLPPTADATRAFLADATPQAVKRQAVIDSLIGNDAFVEHWTNKWADLLQVNGKFLGREGATAFRGWIRDHVAKNTPYDQFAREILTASGSNAENPAASYYKILRGPEEIMENTTHLFLATRFNCNKCHDHPFERWTQDQYYETAAWFARVGFKEAPEAKGRKIGQTAVEKARPLYELVYDLGEGEVTHERTGAVTQPQFPYPATYEPQAQQTRREELARWMTSPDNLYFASSYTNRIWGYLTGTGLIEPLDDIRAGNPPSNPELLDWLTSQFIESGFDVRHLIRIICQSRTYQLSVATHQWNADDTLNYSHAKARRLPAEVLFDAIHAATGSTPRIPGVAPGTRAAQLPDVGVELPDGFLGTLGRPVRESSCECERSTGLQLGPVMALMSGPTVGNAISDPANALAKIASEAKDEKSMIDEIFLRLLNRPATETEIVAAGKAFGTLPADHAKAEAALMAHEEKFPDNIAREAARVAAVEAARTDLQKHEAATAEARTKANEARTLKINQAREAVSGYLQSADERMLAWVANAQDSGPAWKTFQPDAMKPIPGTKIEPMDDGSLFVSGGEGTGDTTLTGIPGLQTITGFRLEALTDKRLPKNGPGRATGDGNFVLTEISLESADGKAIPLALATAHFAQKNYGVATAIDGRKSESNNGWAIAPQMGKNHEAVFTLAQPVELAPETKLTIRLTQNFNSKSHMLGRYRIAFTDSANPKLSPPEAIQKLRAIEVEKRTEAQTKQLLDFWKANDPELARLQHALKDAEAPLPVDPEMAKRRKALADAEAVPLPDPKLNELRRVAALSKKQLDQARLTNAQDLAWALINSPAFLFNY